MTNLEVLELRRNLINDSDLLPFAEQLSNITKLKRLELDENCIKRMGINFTGPYLINISGLQYLNLASIYTIYLLILIDNHFHSHGIIDLCKYLSVLPNLKGLAINHEENLSPEIKAILRSHGVIYTN